jgi:N-acetylglucosamine-6-phosphate deacetylase
LERTLLRNCILLDPEANEPQAGALLLDGEHIAARLGTQDELPEDARRVDLGGARVAPGCIDVHVHGRCIFAAPGQSAAALRHDAGELARHGTTAFLSTTVAGAVEELAQRVEALAAASAEHAADGARCLGIHLEGPWLNPEAAGAQPVAGIRPPSRSEALDLVARAAGLLRMVTLAPELEGCAAVQEALLGRGVRVALGHSLATSEQAGDAVTRGASHVTHLFNAMGPLHQRAPGLAGTALADDRLSCDLICDGVHVAPELVRVAARVKRERLLFISDAIDPSTAGGDFGAGGLAPAGFVWRLTDGRLAGSRSCLTQGIATAVSHDAMTQLEAVAACTLRPARLLGLEAVLGTLRPGARADLIVLGEQGELRQTWIGGRCVHRLG